MLEEIETDDEHFWIEKYQQREERKEERRKEKEEEEKNKKPKLIEGMEYVFKTKVYTSFYFFRIYLFVSNYL